MFTPQYHIRKFYLHGGGYNNYTHMFILTNSSEVVVGIPKLTEDQNNERYREFHNGRTASPTQIYDNKLCSWNFQ